MTADKEFREERSKTKGEEWRGRRKKKRNEMKYRNGKDETALAFWKCEPCWNHWTQNQHHVSSRALLSHK